MKTVIETRKLAERRSWQHIFKKQIYTVETDDDIQILADCAKRTIAAMTKQPFDSIVAEKTEECLIFKTAETGYASRRIAERCSADISHLRVDYMRTYPANEPTENEPTENEPTSKIPESVNLPPKCREPRKPEPREPRTVTTQFERPDHPVKHTPEKHILEPVVWWCDSRNDISELTQAFACEMRKQGIHTAHANSGDISTHTSNDGVVHICCRNFSIGYRTCV